ncbi:MAG: glycosyltransferase [Chloroflexia bacterium]
MKLSVLIITYNQEAYIAQAIESALAQETTFDYEIVIGEDCSTDRTHQIVADFQRSFPDRIRAMLRPANVGMHHNFAETLAACRGQYVALLEGDDYWTDPGKLQRQVDFLDSHPECAICFHNVNVIHEDGTMRPSNYCPDNLKEISTLEDILTYDFIPTCSTVFRRSLFGDLPGWYSKLPTGDWALHILNAEHGKIGYLNEVMAVYRIHSGGVWSSQDHIRNLRVNTQVQEKLNVYLGYKYDRIIRAALSQRYFELAVAYRKAGDLPRAKKFGLRSLRRRTLHGGASLIALFRFLTRLSVLAIRSSATRLKKLTH